MVKRLALIYAWLRKIIATYKVIMQHWIGYGYENESKKIIKKLYIFEVLSFLFWSKHHILSNVLKLRISIDITI